MSETWETAKAIGGLSESMLAALLAIGGRTISAFDLGIGGSAMKALAERGLVDADCDGTPPLYSRTQKGRDIAVLLNGGAIPGYEPAINRIQRIVADASNIPLAEMVSARRSRQIARPRQVAMYLAKQLTPKSLPDIGRRFGNRDHTTVIHAIRRVDELRKKDRKFDDAIKTLEMQLRSTGQHATGDKPEVSTFADVFASA